MNGFFTERRQYPRFPTKIPLTYRESDSTQEIEAQSRDISAQGLCIVTEEEVPVGETLDISLQMQDTGEGIMRKGRVVWLSAFNHLMYKLGIKLDEPPLKPIALVLRTIKKQRDY